MKILGIGALLTLLVAGLLGWRFGASGFPAALLMGAVATIIEVFAVRALRRGLAAPGTAGLFAGFGIGFLYRLLGVGLFLGLVLWDGARFPPIPTGLGYVGVLIPLLFLEARTIR